LVAIGGKIGTTNQTFFAPQNKVPLLEGLIKLHEPYHSNNVTTNINLSERKINKSFNAT